MKETIARNLANNIQNRESICRRKLNYVVTSGGLPVLAAGATVKYLPKCSPFYSKNLEFLSKF